MQETPSLTHLVSLADFKPGELGVIGKITDEFVAGKLVSMGVMVGKMVIMVRVAPFGGGFYIKAGSNNLVLRQNEASNIWIETSKTSL